MISLEGLLGRLDGVKRTGEGQYMAKCPVHDDHRASLAVRMGTKKDKILLNCRAGCQIEDILSRIGLTVDDLKPSSPGAAIAGEAKTAPGSGPKSGARGKAAPGPAAGRVRKLCNPPLRVGGEYVRKWEQNGQWFEAREEIVKEYVYQDAAGAPLLKVFRTKEKNFPVIHSFEGKWYWGDGGMTHWLYHLPDVMEAVKARRWVYIVEGEKDVETMEAAGFCGTTDKGGAGKLDWGEGALAPLQGAKVVIIPDNDEPGLKYARMIAGRLKGYAAEVRLIDLKAAGLDISEKGDISDVRAGMDADGFRGLVQRLTDTAVVLHGGEAEPSYQELFLSVPDCKVSDGCIMVPYKRGHVPLCNFVALPVEETTLDNGDEKKIRLKIAGWDQSGRRMPDALVAADKFSAMGWVVENWALAACIEPGTSSKDRLRAILQKAGHIHAARRTVYQHTGWRMVSGKPVFLHGGGAIGAEGVGVELPYGLDRYDLTGIVDGELGLASDRDRKRYAMSYSMRFLGNEIAQRVSVPMTAFMYLSPLRHFLEADGYQPSFIPFLRGRSGRGKSTFAALVLRHFGPRFSIRSMPASFKDTSAGISLKLYSLKDMPLLVDDYHPENDPIQKRKVDTVAQEVSRMIGDGTMRSRMRADTSAQVDRPARGAAFETGEQLPDVSYSGVARVYVIDIGAGDVPIGSGGMNELEEQSKKGVLAEAMRGYIEWLIPQYGSLERELGRRYEALRKEAQARETDEHKRISDAAAHLMLGLEMMLKYAVSIELLTADDVSALMDQYWRVILDNSARQAVEMVDEKPTKMYLDTLRELLISGRCQVMDTASKALTTTPQGLIGYKGPDYYYFIPGLALGAVQKAFQEQGRNFPLGKIMLSRMLAEDGVLLKDASSGKYVKQLRCGPIHGWFQWIPRYFIDGGERQERTEQVGFEQVNDPDNPYTKEAGADERN